MILLLEDVEERAEAIAKWLTERYGEVPLWFTDPEVFISYLAEKPMKYRAFSLDHDLGHFLTGYDVAKWIAQNQIDVEVIYIHSMNPEGAKNMQAVLEKAGYSVRRLLI